MLISADYVDLCVAEGPDYYALLIVVEAGLIVVVVSKLAYDWATYKRTGEMPWLARHICLGYSYSSLLKVREGMQSLRESWVI